MIDISISGSRKRPVKEIRANAPQNAPVVTDSRCVSAVLDDATHKVFTDFAKRYKQSRASIARALIKLGTLEPELIERAINAAPSRQGVKLGGASSG